jgi:carboxymethylenebutenolidase
MNMSGELIDVKTEDGVADAYLAGAGTDEKRPAVLLIVDAFGLRPQIEGMADRIADAGYVVLAPNVFYRASRAPVLSLEGLEDPEKRGPLLEKLRPLMAELTTERIVSDSQAYLDLLEDVGNGPVAITGYCMGGRLGWRIAAAHGERVAALGAFHTGGLVTDDAESPHLSAGDLSSTLYFGFADDDGSMTAEMIATLDAALDGAGADYRSEVYEGAIHGYTMADTPAYDEAAAERHFAALLDLLGRTVAA